jgi:signal peptidase I
MFPIFLAVLLAFLGLGTGYVINQLPGLKNFPGRNAFLLRILGEIALLSVIVAAISGQKDSNAEQLALLQGVACCVGLFLVFDCLLTGSTAWKHYTSGSVAGIDDEKQRLELLKSVSEDVRQRQRENFKNLEPQVVIPLGLQDVREEVGQSRFIATEDSQETRAAQPKLLLELKRIFRWGDRPDAEIPATQRLIDVFHRADRRLLILGKPGAGKTTLLLELAEQLLAEAQQLNCNEIPVMLECSNWKDDNQTLSDWLILQLKDKYKVPFGLSRQWIDRRQLVPLLDGLDELGLERQQKATTAIAKFIKDNNYPAMVICCRQEEWQQARAAEAQETQFGLNGAVYLEPLTDAQIHSYLQQVQRPGLWAHIQSSDLQALLPDWDTCQKDVEVPGLRSPLLLNMLLVAYNGQAIRSQSELFQAYIKAQFIRSGKSKYTEAQTRRYLTWLAQQLKAEKTTEFEIENLQPNWLADAWQIWICRLIFGLILGLTQGIILGVIDWLAFARTSRLISGLFASLIFGLIFGLFGIVEGIPIIDSFDLSVRGIRRGLTVGLTEGLTVSLAVGLIAGLIAGLSIGLFYESISILVLVIIFGSIGGLISGLIFGSIGGLIVGLESKEVHNKTYPNKGIWNTAKNSVSISIFCFLIGILLSTVIQLVVGQSVEWKKLILFGIAGSFFGIFTFLGVMYHVVLRLLLWANGSIPWNYAVFLDYANKLRLIQSMGGRYRFVHDLIREEMISSMPPVIRLASSVTKWKKYLGFFLSILVVMSIAWGTETISAKQSQENTPMLHTGDSVFFDRYSYRFIEPKRDDLVGFWRKDFKDTSHKWIVGLPGETISSKNSQLLINGEPIDRPYTNFSSENFSIDEPFQVPAQRYLVAGKEIDKDGKTVPTLVLIHRKQVIDRCLWRLWPLHRFGAIN